LSDRHQTPLRFKNPYLAVENGRFVQKSAWFQEKMGIFAFSILENADSVVHPEA
jgi:hypothetical protein